MTRSLILGGAMLVSLLALASPDAFRERVERNIQLLRTISDCTEGYAASVEGSTIIYPSFRTDPSRALITRATSGTMAITWTSHPAPAVPAGREVSFVVMAGLYGQEPSGFKFRLSVNGTPRFEFVTTPKEEWEVAGRDGGKLRFVAATRDKYRDLFGCLLITVPSAWVTPGEPARFSLVGEKADNPAWCMVFESGDVIRYQQELVANEAFCDVTFRPAGERSVLEFQGPSNWVGRDVSVTAAADLSAQSRFVAQDGGSRAELTLATGRVAAPFAVMVGGEPLIRLDSVFTETRASQVYPRKLVSHAAPRPDATGWRLRYESTYHPGLGLALQELADLTGERGRLHLVISTHQDIAWMDSPENCVRDRDEKIITPLLEIMKRDTSYHFDLEDVLCLREYLERHPGRKDEIHRLIRDGRLAIGASFNQPYEDLCSGEMLVREFIAGRGWLRREFPGCDTRLYWNPDVPGRTLQMPQVMRRAGVDYLSMSRFSKGLYSWISPDGSSILAFSPGHYADFKARVEGTGFDQAAGYIASAAADWMKATGFVSHDIPLISMSDMSGPDRYDSLLARWSTIGRIMNTDGTPMSLSLPPIRQTTLQAYLDRVAPARSAVPVVRGERPNIWLYIHGPTHHHAISAKRESDVLLPAAEIFNSVDALLQGSFASYPQTELTGAWEAQIYPDHGWGGKNGEITDSTFKARYETARDISSGLLQRSLTSIASRVAQAPEAGIPIVVFNSLSWKRTGPVRVTVHPQAGQASAGLELRSHGGEPVPVQVDVNQRHADGSIAAAELLFVAQDVPPVGYATFHARPSKATAPAPAPAEGVTTLENAYYRLELGQGGVKQIVDRELNEPVLDAEKFLGGELFTMQSVGEDAGEWSEPQLPTMEGFDRLANHPATWTRVESGPVREVVEARYTLAHTSVVQRVILYAAIKRVDFEVSLLGWDGTKYREFRLAFPVRADQGRVAYEVPFGTLELGTGEMKGAAGERYTQEVSQVRPRAIQNWIGQYGSRLGVTLSSSVAVWDHIDPTEPASQRLMLQPVLLASRRSCHGEGPWYLQQGDHHYRFSLTSHAAGWQNGHRQGVEANAPLFAVADPGRAATATLAPSGSFLSLGAENLILSTMKKSETGDAVIVRLFESTGKPATGSLAFTTPVTKAEETNLLEDVERPLRSDRNRVALEVGPYEIRTVKITPAR